MRVLSDIPFEIDENEVFRRMRIGPDSEYAPEIRAMTAAARTAARPKALYDVAFVEERGEDSVLVGGQRFVSRALRANMEGVERVFPHVATCGAEMDAIAAPPGDTISEFCRDVIKQMALGAARTALLDDLKRRYALKRLTGMSPGAGDRNVWPIEQQKELFALLGDTRATVGVTLTDSCLMIPNKSVSGLLYASDVDFVACQLCHRQVCPGRKAPFDQALWKARMGEGNC